MQNIKYINLDGNKISNINAIQNWNRLEECSFQNNNLSQLLDLTSLSNLKILNVSNNKITTINNMPKLEALEELEIDSNNLTSLEGIQNLTNLKILSCSNNQISDISGLENLSKLENINLNKNLIQNIEKLKQNSLIEYLYLDNNYIMNFDTLKELENLQKFSIYNQTISVEIKEKLVENYILVPLPKLYTDLYDKESIIYNENATTQVEGAEEYEIDSNNENIKLKIEDLKSNKITLQVSDETNTILKYSIQVDNVPPSVFGVEESKIYFQAVTPTCQDDDIDEVKLFKDNQQIEYELGNEIKENGTYTLSVKDYMGNETIINFEIKSEVEDGEKYKIEGQYITNISHSTSLQTFKENLSVNVNYTIYRDDNILEDEQFVATGDELVTQTGSTYYLVVRGDISKDGITNVKDLVIMRKYLLQIQEFDEIEEKAADVSEDLEVTIKDLVQIRKIIINKLD